MSTVSDVKAFEKILDDNIGAIFAIIGKEMAIPDFPLFCKQLRPIYEECKSNKGGNLANYIPQLSKFDPEKWGVSVCTVDGQRFSIGDVNDAFTIQSCHKPFTYGINLNELGHSEVNKYIGQEPSGRDFNEICLDSKS